MAKKDKPFNRLDALKAATEAHQFEVGPGGNIYKDPTGSCIRGVTLPSLGLMELFGKTVLRDSCSILIDGEPNSSKSSLALEFFNWIRPYGGSGVYIDAENKSAMGIASGLLDDIHLWHPYNRVEFMSLPTVEDVQIQVHKLIQRCTAANKDVERDWSIPFIAVIDPLSGLPSQEHQKSIDKSEGATDRGHGGRDEALLWSKWIKDLNSRMINLPFIFVAVNHMKIRQEQRGPIQIERKVNPGGIAQNYAVTAALRCTPLGRQELPSSVTGDYFQTIKVECIKHSHGPTGHTTTIRKYARRCDDGTTIFWWDWGRNTAEFLAELNAKHESREIVSVSKETDSKFTCKQLGIRNEEPGKLGDMINADKKIMDQLIQVFRWERVKEYRRLQPDEYELLKKQASEIKQKRLEELRKEQEASEE